MAISITPITSSIFSSPVVNHLTLVSIPPINIIDVSTFQTGVLRNAPNFHNAPPRVGRIGVFAAASNGAVRAVILLLPQSSTPSSILVGITHGFGQRADYYRPLGWNNPLSVSLIQDVASRFVVQRWGSQMLAQTRKNLGLLLIVRASGNELGPFSHNGHFLAQVLTSLAVITNGAFSFSNVEFFTYSSGIHDLNGIIRSAHRHLSVSAIYNLDPASALPVVHFPGVSEKQFLSGQTGNPRRGFEYLPMPRWANDPEAFRWPNRLRMGVRGGVFEYLHNHCLPDYCLYLGIQTS